MNSLPEEEREDAWTALRQSVRAAQPIRVGGYAGEERREGFIKWAQRTLSPGDVRRIQQVDETYRKTAQDLGLMAR